MAHNKGRIEIDEERCKGCGLCVSVCPYNILSLKTIPHSKGNFIAVFNNQENCVGCQFCAIICPDIAIEVYLQKRQPRENNMLEKKEHK